MSSRTEDERRRFEQHSLARARLFKVTQHTAPGPESQLEATASHFDEQGNPVMAVVDGQTLPMTDAYLAMARALVPLNGRIWKYFRRKRNPTL